MRVVVIGAVRPEIRIGVECDGRMTVVSRVCDGRVVAPCPGAPVPGLPGAWRCQAGRGPPRSPSSCPTSIDLGYGNGASPCPLPGSSPCSGGNSTQSTPSTKPGSGSKRLARSSAASSVTSSVSGAPSSPARSTPPWPDLNHQIPRPAPPHATTLCGRSCIGPCQRYGLSVEPQARASGHPFNPRADSRYTRGQLASLISPCPSHS